MFTERHEQDLAEIKALHREFGERAAEVLEQIKRIQKAHPKLAAQDQRQASAVVDGDDAGPLLAFVHIPKTAGGTVTAMLAAAYSKTGIGKTGNYMKGPENAASKIARRPGGWERWQRSGGRVTVGHLPYRLFREHLPPDTRYMTFLRDPVDRVLSHYYRHIRRKDPRRAGSALRRHSQGWKVKADSIQEALVEMQVPQLKNLATRFLCNDPSPSGELPASALDEAKANLREFAFVGIQERFEESLVLLQRTLGLDLVPQDTYEDRHVSIDRPAVEEIPDEQRALIVERNQFDVELYRFGQELFESAVAGADEGFAADVETLRARSAAVREEESRAM